MAGTVPISSSETATARIGALTAAIRARTAGLSGSGWLCSNRGPRKLHSLATPAGNRADLLQGAGAVCRAVIHNEEAPAPLHHPRGPCSASPHQMSPACAASKLRRSSGWLAAPHGRDMSCCCNSRWIAERETCPGATSPSPTISFSRMFGVRLLGLLQGGLLALPVLGGSGAAGCRLGAGHDTNWRAQNSSLRRLLHDDSHVCHEVDVRFAVIERNSSQSNLGPRFPGARSDCRRAISGTPDQGGQLPHFLLQLRLQGYGAKASAKSDGRFPVGGRE
jgi:hypothetical protein